MKSIRRYCLTTLVLIVTLGSASRSGQPVTSVIQYVRNGFSDFGASAVALESAIARIDPSNPQTVEEAKSALKTCRLRYKRIQFFLEYFFWYAAVSYNTPPKVEIEEPTLEYNEPVGLQVVESLLFQDDATEKKQELMQHAAFIRMSSQDLNSLLYNFRADIAQIVESLRLELIRVMTLTIAGFDAPLLKSGIEEANVSLSAIEDILKYLAVEDGMRPDSVLFYLQRARTCLVSNPDFDSFDRLYFLTDYALPLQRQMGRFIDEQGLELNTTEVLNYRAEDLFSPDALDAQAFLAGEGKVNDVRIELGRRLFFEKKLSGNDTRNCATCHVPQKYFTDGLPKSSNINGRTLLQRNAPSLFYAAFQHNLFWDGRVKSLEEQVASVIKSPAEMNGKPSVIARKLDGDGYRDAFAKAFPEETDSLIALDNIAHAIAAFIRTLQPRNSRFDRYMQGDKQALAEAEKRGFNLFMGKAQCGTCHFAPLFNGLLPPYYRITEVEVLGVPRTGDLENPEPDPDAGRFDVHGIEFQRGAFKTPTVRNVAFTAPYMHNGSMESLEKVMDFYNKGGGVGLGIPVHNQTLSNEPLNLTAQEVDDVIQFMHALTDANPFLSMPGSTSQKTSKH